MFVWSVLPVNLHHRPPHSPTNKHTQTKNFTQSRAGTIHQIATMDRGGDGPEKCAECSAEVGDTGARCVHPECGCGSSFCIDCIYAGALDAHYARADALAAEAAGAKGAEWAARRSGDEVARITSVSKRTCPTSWNKWYEAARECA